MAARGGLRKDDSEVVFDTSEDVEVTNSFETLNLKEDLLRGIYAYGKTIFSLCIDRLPHALLYVKHQRWCLSLPLPEPLPLFYGILFYTSLLPPHNGAVCLFSSSFPLPPPPFPSLPLSW